MAEYIEREALLNKLKERDLCLCVTEQDIKDAPAADVAPVRHGRWILRGGKRYCPECGNRACVNRDSDDFWYTVGTDFCPYCGAKMDLEV